jgi:exonuclease SbcC
MIPLTLKLRNFMAYQKTELDFQRFQLAVLTGPNGAGKSSLLDAITWALWGKARGSSDDDLIHLGASEMEVEYTFGLQGNTHRVIRKRNSKNRGRTVLEFQAKTEMGWRTLTEGSIRATQIKISQIMRLDYDTFINSAFLLQGRDDEFTTKTAGQRKQILSDILGLAIYDIYSDRAKDRAREKKTDVTVYDAKIKQIDEELKQKSTYESELKTVEVDVGRLSKQREIAELEERALSDRYRDISEKQRQLDDLQARLKHDETDRGYLRQTVAQVQANLEQHQAVLARRTEIEQGLFRLKEARNKVIDWDKRSQETRQLSDQRHALQRQLDNARSEIEAELRAITTKVEWLTPKAAAKESLQDGLQALEHELEQLQQIEQKRNQERQTVNQIETELARLNEQQNQITNEGKELKTKLAELQQAGSHCPVCKSVLNEEHRAKAVAQFEHEISGKRVTYRQNSVDVKQLETQQITLQESLADVERQLKELPALQGQVGRLKQSLSEAEQAVVELEQAKRQLAAVQVQLDKQAFAEEIRTTLTEVQTALTQIHYDQEAHQKAKEDEKQLAHFEIESRNLADAEQRLPEEESRLNSESGRLSRLESQIDSGRQTIITLEHETADLPALSQQLQTAKSDVTRLQTEERQVRDKVAATKQKLSYLVTLAKRRAEHNEGLQQVREELGIYRELQAAFGKNGVQALLIETAIPEIEQEANQLLSRITDGRMNLKFETQREAKTGDNIIETLDIRIADELGTRGYDMFSGGEAFRINFAIRIAISKVLARRAGAQLQTLIIDEGFGSQDEQGRERLIEAINSIREDFEKVIVITHIEALKDAFPVRIEVEKLPDGSQLSIR